MVRAAEWIQPRIMSMLRVWRKPSSWLALVLLMGFVWLPVYYNPARDAAQRELNQKIYAFCEKHDIAPKDCDLEL